MIYITGDTHIPVDIQKLSSKLFPRQKEMTKDDYVIICGDFGGVWDGTSEEKYWLKWLKSKNFTTLFVDGNHENFDALNNFSLIDFAGGKVHCVENGIYHLLRGEIYRLDGKSFFTFGGASSHDKQYRKEGKNWWADEMPSAEQYENARKNLKAHNFSVDYVISHSAPTDIQKAIAPEYESNELTEFLQEIKNKVLYKHWYFGHYHKDAVVDEKHTAVFNEKILI